MYICFRVLQYLYFILYFKLQMLNFIFQFVLAMKKPLLSSNIKDKRIRSVTWTHRYSDYESEVTVTLIWMSRGCWSHTTAVLSF